MSRNTNFLAGILIAIGVMLMPVAVLAAPAALNGACTADGDCSLEACRSNACYCEVGAFRACTLRVEPDGICTDTRQCRDGYQCSGSVCVLPADDPYGKYCWCKKTDDGTCQNHRLNDAPAGSRKALVCDGGVTGDAQTATLCSAYCTSLSMRAVHCENTYHNYNASDSTANEANKCKPSTAPAETPAETPPAGMGSGGPNFTTPSEFGLLNPLGTTDVREIISKIIRAVLGVVGALFLVMFVYGGVMWMTAGDSKRIDTAKKTFVNAVIGMVIVAFSYSMVSLVFNLAGQVVGGGGGETPAGGGGAATCESRSMCTAPDGTCFTTPSTGCPPAGSVAPPPPPPPAPRSVANGGACTLSSQCSNSLATCDGGVCRDVSLEPLRANGAACATGAQCSSGNCVSLTGSVVNTCEPR